MSGPAVTVYIPCRDYGRWLGAAIESALDQTHIDVEVLVVDDGSTDETPTVLAAYAERRRVRVMRNDRPLGIRSIMAQVLERTTGDWLLRLDADDLLHPMAIELLLAEATRDPAADLVYPDYFYLSEAGDVTGVECLPSADGSHVSSVPPHGAGCLVRRTVLDEHRLSHEFHRRDGHELWLKLVLAGQTVRHVALPLFYYRQHPTSWSMDHEALRADTSGIVTAAARDLPDLDRITYLIAVRALAAERDGALDERLLKAIGTAGSSALEAGATSVVVSTDSVLLAAHVRDHMTPLVCLERSGAAASPDATVRDVLLHARLALELEDDDAICLIGLEHGPLTAAQVREAIDVFRIFEPDSVLAVYEERSLCFRLGAHGLQPLNPARQYALRREREAVYIDPGSLRIVRAKNVDRPEYLGARIAHVTLPHPDDQKGHGRGR